MQNMDNSERRRLDLIGITYNQIESGVYALILQEENGKRRIPIIIGYPEAQAIECKLQEVVTPRPLTHDLTVNIMGSFELSLREVEIYRLENGVFAANLYITNGRNTHVIDARSSDAIALAIRVGAPIYASLQLIEEAGFSPSDKETGKASDALEPKQPAPKGPVSLETQSDERLQQMMATAVANENYEEAARIKHELDKRKNK